MSYRRACWLSVLLLLLLLLLPSVIAAQDVLHGRDQAAAILREMVGTWQIERENAPTGVPSTYGVRTIRAGLDELTLEWEESREPGAESRGFVGYDPMTGSYYMTGVHDNPNLRVSFLRGMPQGDGREIRWEPVDLADNRRSVGLLITSVLRIEGDGGMVWRAFDDGWVFNLVRL